MHCECSPAASWAILQWDTQLKLQGDHHHLNPVLLSAGWKARISSAFLPASIKPGLQTVPWPNSAFMQEGAFGSMSRCPCWDLSCASSSQILVRATQRSEHVGSEGDRMRRSHLCLGDVPCTTPQGYCLAFAILLPIFTSSVLPTTAKGRWTYRKERDNEAGDFLCCLAKDCFSRKLFTWAALLDLRCLNAFAIRLVF